MVVPVRQSGLHQDGVGQIGVRQPIVQLVEQPVRCAIRVAGAAIRIECGFEMSVLHRRRDVGVPAPVPGLVEIPVRGMAHSLPEREVIIQKAAIRPIRQRPRRFGISQPIPNRIENRPDDRGFARQSQRVPYRTIERPHGGDAGVTQAAWYGPRRFVRGPRSLRRYSRVAPECRCHPARISAADVWCRLSCG